MRCVRLRPGQVKPGGFQVFVTQPPSQVMNRLACVSHLFTDNLARLSSGWLGVFFGLNGFFLSGTATMRESLDVWFRK
jgi:hypothetical protein